MFSKYIRRFVLPLSAAAILAACTEEVEVYTSDGIGVATDVFDVDAAGGTVQIDVYADGPYSVVRVPETADWFSAPASGEGDGTLSVDVYTNEDVARMASLILRCNTSERSDTVFIRQRGIADPYLRVADTGWILGADGKGRFSVETNVPTEDISSSVSYDVGDTPWVEDVAIIGSGDGIDVAVSARANPETRLRKAHLILSFTNGWGEVVSLETYLTQAGSDGSSGTPVSIPDLRALASEDGTVLDEDLVLEGIVVSTKESGNMGENEQTSPATVDYTLSDRTFYVQAEDGRYGIKLVARSSADNPFECFDHIRISLRGAKLFKARKYIDTDPDFYWLEDVLSSRIISRVEGSRSDVPEKRKHMSELTDDDIYTYVTLTDVELPVRKGPMTPINEGYANAGGSGRTDKFAIILRDIEGRSLYVMTNTTCPYRRTGQRLPYGSGTMSGIIVHEHFRRFNYEDNDTGDEETYGDIGRYQIRHTRYEDFGMARDMEEASFSRLIAEWRYVTAKNLVRYPATGGEDADAWFTHSYQYPASHSLNGLSCVNMAVDYTYLGPVGTSDGYIFGRNIGNVNGLGVILADGTDWMAPGYTGTNASQLTNINNNTGHQGKGQVPAAVGSAWYVWYNKNIDTGQMQSYVIKFSTAGIASDRLSVQLSMLNFITSNSYGPRWFNLEYSFTDATGLDDSQWTWVTRFNVPDNSNWSPTTPQWQSPGFKPMDFALPTTLLGRETVYLRLRGEDDHRGSATVYDAGVGTANTTLAWTGLNYIGIRCNK